MSSIASVTASPDISHRPRAEAAASFPYYPKRRGRATAMNWVALRMLTGDRAKYLGLVFAIAFSSFLIVQQSSLFCAFMNRTRSVILGVTDADIWVTDPATQYIDEVFALKDSVY